MRNLSNKELRYGLKYLKDSLPGKPTAVRGLYSLPKTLDHAFNGSTQNKESALQKISDHMGHFLGLLRSVKVSFVDKTESGLKTHTVFVTDDDGNIARESKNECVEEEKYAGLYNVRGYDHREITIVNDSSFYLIHFLSVLAHEVTHNYLYQHQIHSSDEIDSEILTDLAAIFLGFGGTILHGYEPSSAISYRLGYIDVTTVRRAILQSYLLRNWKVKDIVGQFSRFESNRCYFQRHLFPMVVYKILFSSRSRISPEQKPNEKMVIPCNSCGQKLRVPNSQISLKINCPKCGSSFIFDNSEPEI